MPKEVGNGVRQDSDFWEKIIRDSKSNAEGASLRPYREDPDHTNYDRLLIEYEAVLNELQRERASHEATREAMQRRAVKGLWRSLRSTLSLTTGAAIGCAFFLVWYGSCGGSP